MFKVGHCYKQASRYRESLTVGVPNYMTIELAIAYKNACKYDQINILKVGLTASTSKEQKHFNDKAEDG
jgi:hypothetical protein